MISVQAPAYTENQGFPYTFKMTIGGPEQPRPATSYFLALSSHFGMGRNLASAIR